MAEAVAAETGVTVPLLGRHDDRTAARRLEGRRHREDGRVSSPSAPTTSRRRRSASRATTLRPFLGPYTAKGILAADPFVTLDQEGRRRTGVDRGRARARYPARPSSSASAVSTVATRPSIAFCEAQGLDYVSCSPFRVPIARLAAAQAALEKPGQTSGEKHRTV